MPRRAGRADHRDALRRVCLRRRGQSPARRILQQAGLPVYHGRGEPAVCPQAQGDGAAERGAPEPGRLLPGQQHSGRGHPGGGGGLSGAGGEHPLLPRHPGQERPQLYVAGERRNRLSGGLRARGGHPAGGPGRQPEHFYRGGRDADRLSAVRPLLLPQLAAAE